MSAPAQCAMTEDAVRRRDDRILRIRLRQAGRLPERGGKPRVHHVHQAERSAALLRFAYKQRKTYFKQEG
jgi:hypothetical protein